MGKNSHTGRNIAVSAVVAGAVGYLAGILTAPKSGKETREDLKNATSQAKDEAIAKLNALRSEVDELLVLAKQRGGDLNSKAKKELSEAVKKAKLAQAKANAVLKAAKSGKAKDPDLKSAVEEARKARDHLKTFLKK